MLGNNLPSSRPCLSNSAEICKLWSRIIYTRETFCSDDENKNIKYTASDFINQIRYTHAVPEYRRDEKFAFLGYHGDDDVSLCRLSATAPCRTAVGDIGTQSMSIYVVYYRAPFFAAQEQPNEVLQRVSSLAKIVENPMSATFATLLYIHKSILENKDILRLNVTMNDGCWRLAFMILGSYLLGIST